MNNFVCVGAKFFISLFFVLVCWNFHFFNFFINLLLLLLNRLACSLCLKISFLIFWVIGVQILIWISFWWRVVSLNALVDFFLVWRTDYMWVMLIRNGKGKGKNEQIISEYNAGCLFRRNGCCLPGVCTSRADPQCCIYVDVLERLRKRVFRVGKEIAAARVLHHDNTSSHCSYFREFLLKHNWATLSQSAYCLDLAAGDYFLFPKIKTALKGQLTALRRSKPLWGQLWTRFWSKHTRTSIVPREECVDARRQYF